MLIELAVILQRLVPPAPKKAFVSKFSLHRSFPIIFSLVLKASQIQMQMKLILYERLCHWPRFDRGAQGNSEMLYCNRLVGRF